MSKKKIRLHLEIGLSIQFKNVISMKADPKNTVELVDFKIQDNRVEWTLRLGNGELVEGRIGDTRPFPMFEGSWVCLSIPITLHVKRNGALSPDFVFFLPDTIVADFGKANSFPKR